MESQNPAPAGTVTFLFSDVESSTRMWEAHPEAMAAALETHDHLVRSAVAEHGGFVFSTAGDSFAVAFARSADAVAAALAVQRSLASEQWGETPIAVRIGIHTGEAVERDGDYFGPTLNRCARLMAAGHGGQVLVSAACAHVVADRLPEGASLIDLGERRLKDLSRPERVFQLAHSDLSREFPPLRTLDASPNNLPISGSSFVGRDDEVRSVVERLREVRLLTLTGVGGVGKTRLALQVAADLTDAYSDGAWLVEFAAIGEPGLVPKQIAAALGIQEQADRPVGSTVLDALADREALLVLDNCEHLVDAIAAVVDDVIRSCPGVTVLATSREPLGVSGEARWPVSPLPTASPSDDQDAVRDLPSVELFVDRARLVDPGFEPVGEDAAACVEICRRLGGVPLAIELAAARVGVFSPREIARRIEDQLAFLTTGPRTVEPRQRTLRAAIDWSYELLDADERWLLRHLSVFRGGFALEAIEALWAELGNEAKAGLDVLLALVEKSLVVKAGTGSGRFFLLEAIRQFAEAQLDQEGEFDDAVGWHTAWFAAWAARQGRRVSTPDQLDALDALEADHDNLRVLLERSVSAGELGPALQVAGDIAFFWWLHSHFGESGTWFRTLVAESEGSSDHVRAKLLVGAGEFWMSMSEHDTADRLLTEAGQIGERIGLERVQGWALAYRMTNETYRMEFTEARRLGDAASELFERAGDVLGMGYTEFMRVSVEYADARMRGEPVRGLAARLEPMISSARVFGERNLAGHLVDLAGAITADEGNLDRSREFLSEAVDAFDELGNQICLAHALDHVALATVRADRPSEAITMLAASTGVRRHIGVSARKIEQAVFDEVLAESQEGADDGREAWDRGAEMTRSEAVAHAHALLEGSVVRGGVEPPTSGFSDRRSTN